MGLQVDYDRLAAEYEQRYKTNRLEGVGAALEGLRRGRVLEVGCGTGHWLRGGDFGVDLSPGMLRQALRGHRALAHASDLPFRDASFDFLFCVNAIHHFPDKAQFIGEARRLLRPGGRLAVIGMDPQLQRGRTYLYEYFEEAWKNDLERFPSWGVVLDLMLAAGFVTFEWRIVERIVTDHTGLAIFDDPFLGKKSRSSLALLSDEAYERGLARIRTDAERGVTFRSEIILGMIVGGL